MSRVKIATVRVSPKDARQVLGPVLHDWLAEYHLPVGGRPYWVTVATAEGVPVGAHAFTVWRRELHSHSTFVLRRARGGTARRLWRHSLAFSGARGVRAHTVSPGGAALMERVRAEHANVWFDVSSSL